MKLDLYIVDNYMLTYEQKSVAGRYALNIEETAQLTDGESDGIDEELLDKKLTLLEKHKYPADTSSLSILDLHTAPAYVATVEGPIETIKDQITKVFHNLSETNPEIYV